MHRIGIGNRYSPPMAIGENARGAIKLWAWMASGVAALAVSIVLGFLVSWWWASITAQLVGAVVTMFGLGHAATRTRYGMGLASWFWSKVRRRGPDQTITTTGIPSAEAVGGFTMSSEARATFALDTSQPMEDQLAQLETQIQNLYALYPAMRQEMTRLNNAITDTQQHAETLASKALNDAKEHTEETLQKRDTKQTREVVLDLNIAIAGLFITVIGQVLAYWS